jgi:GH24 family phage-related lysozyme (muramidase)
MATLTDDSRKAFALKKSKADNHNAELSLSSEGRLKLARTERLVLAYYNDGGKNKGHCTYGYGTLVHRGVCTEEELKLPVTLEMAEGTLNSRIRDAENAVKRNVTYGLNQEQFDALVSYTYNKGPRGALKAVDLINKEKLKEAADYILVDTGSIKNGKKIQLRGLIGRRREEAAPFIIKNDSGEVGK